MTNDEIYAYLVQINADRRILYHVGELLQKDKPMPLIVTNHKCRCPDCGQVVKTFEDEQLFHDPFCRFCGQRLEESNYDY